MSSLANLFCRRDEGRPFDKSRARRTRAFSILEVMVAAVILAYGVAAIYVGHSAVLRQMSAMSQSSVVSDHLMQRVEGLKGATWVHVTDPSYLATVLAAPIAGTDQNVAEITEERITVAAAPIPYMPPEPSPLPSATPAPSPFTVRRTGASSPTVDAGGGSADEMAAQFAVTVTTGASWKDRAGQVHTREISTLLSRAGMAH